MNPLNGMDGENIPPLDSEYKLCDNIRLEYFFAVQKAIELEKGLKYTLTKTEKEFWEFCTIASIDIDLRAGMTKANKTFEDIKDFEVEMQSETSFSIQIKFKI